MPKKQKRQKESERSSKKAGPSRLGKLEKDWTKASREDRLLFLAAVAEQHIDLWTAISPVNRQMIADGRYLLPSTVARIERIMKMRRIRPDEVAIELGFSGEGISLVRALAKGASLRLAMVKALEAWLKAQENLASACDPVSRAR